MKSARRRRLAKFGLIGAAVTGALTACFPVTVPMGQGPMSLQRDGTSIRIAVCEDMNLTSLKGLERQLESPSEWSVFLEAEGALSLTAGDVITITSVQEHLEVGVAREPQIQAARDIEILLQGAAEDGSENRLGVFRLPASGLSETAWLHANGEEAAGPCDAANGD